MNLRKTVKMSLVDLTSFSVRTDHALRAICIVPVRRNVRMEAMRLTAVSRDVNIQGGTLICSSVLL